MRIGRESSAFTNPSLHLRMFKLSNPYVMWAIAHGAYDDSKSRPPSSRDVLDADDRAVARQLGIKFDDRSIYHEMGEGPI